MPVPGFDVPGNYYDPDNEEPDEEKLMSDFRWLIEAPGQRYLAARKLGNHEFHWTQDHDKAIAFRCEAQAVEHGWMADAQ